MASNFDKHLQELLRDNLSGSRIITARAASLFRKVVNDQNVSRTELIGLLRSACRKLEKQHSTMVAVQTFCDSIVMLLDLAPAFDELKTRMIKLLDNWNEIHHQRKTLEIASQIYPTIKEVKTIMSHSYSSTVFHALEYIASRKKNLKVWQTVSYPVREGVSMASLLGQAGFTVELIADGGIATALQETDIVLIGADCVTSNFIVNKQGTLGMAIAARNYGVPVYVLADQSKFSDKDKVSISKQNPDELARLDKKNVTVSNVYFDITPVELITAIVTEQGVFDSDSLSRCFNL